MSRVTLPYFGQDRHGAVSGDMPLLELGAIAWAGRIGAHRVCAFVPTAFRVYVARRFSLWCVSRGSLSAIMTRSRSPSRRSFPFASKNVIDVIVGIENGSV